MRLETHVHTRYSRDSLLCLRMLYLMCRIRRIDWIAITEHNNINGGIAFDKYCRQRGNKVHVIVGEEVYTDSGEIIGLFLKKEIKPFMSPEETIAEIKGQGGVVYVPHPYDEKRRKTVLVEEAINRNRDKIDCIEIHNGRNISVGYDMKQEEIGNRYGIKSIVGSDAHTFWEVGRNYMLIEQGDLNNSEDFIKAIASSDFRKKECLSYVHFITKLAKVIKLVFKGDRYALYRIIIKNIKRSKY